MDSSLRLYHVEIVYAALVAAQDERQAEALAKESLRPIVKSEVPDVFCTGQVKSIGPVWKGTIPWGENQEEFSCEHFVEKSLEAV